MKKNTTISDIIKWFYIIASIIFWITFITGVESIMEHNLFLWFSAIAIVDIIIGKSLNIIHYLSKQFILVVLFGTGSFLLYYKIFNCAYSVSKIKSVI